jgi:thiol-disulfide isomerase/thioredoxin
MKFNRIFAVAFAAIALGCGKPQPSPTAPSCPSMEGQMAPELEGGFTWLNSSPLRLADYRGKPVLLEFYDYSCVNCIRTFPYIKEWIRRYAADGLVTIGVHAPQYEFSFDPKFVYTVNKHLGVDWPVVADSQWTIANAYTNRYWPRILLVDKNGKIRFDHTGEGEYRQAELVIQQLLHEVTPGTTFPPPMTPVRSSDKPGAVCYPVTPELYLGQARGKMGNTEAAGVTTNTPILFQPTGEIEEGQPYALGQWAIESEYLRHTRDVETLSDGVALKYRATEANVVMKPESIYWLEVFVQQDGKWLSKDFAGTDVLYDEEGRSYVKVNMPRMYNLIADQPYGVHELRLMVMGKGLSVYSYSFGTCEMPAKAEKLTAGKP